MSANERYFRDVERLLEETAQPSDTRSDPPPESPGNGRVLQEAASVGAEDTRTLLVVSASDFVAVEEEGAAALVGDEEGNALVPEGGDVMVYGDGGAGKTTLAIDLACHLAAGDEWLGIRVLRPSRVLLIENEGPRPQFRGKLKRKLEAWSGSELGDRLQVLEGPWSMVTLDDDGWREALAQEIALRAIDLVALGPVTRAGMNEAGTLQEVRDYMALVADVRRLSGRSVVFVLIHHENKGGKVSGAWEGAGDTLLHVQGQGHGRTRVFIQKARWSSVHHGTSLQLAWADGDGFLLTDDAERDDATIADEILEAVGQASGTPWSKLEETVSGKGERLRRVRDRLMESGQLVNVGTEKRMKLWRGDDPALPATLDSSRPDRDGMGTGTPAAPEEPAEVPDRVPRPHVVGTGTGRDAVPPDARGRTEA